MAGTLGATGEDNEIYYWFRLVTHPVKLSLVEKIEIIHAGDDATFEFCHIKHFSCE